ncbi:hypothetical protein TPSD3_16170 [Thioflexithrix psekupsensis]|uniref:Uncharacterized protein n=2 Tax=Thioflexithrix psekupsensis TaxID=1570016 RepID=A0A251X5I6_9GAMM|nr:hypothetical protein TPSD3_16170 [Thioflexithrix psekupsensis]
MDLIMNTQYLWFKVLIILFLSGNGLAAEDNVLLENDPSLPQSNLLLDPAELNSIRNEQIYPFYVPIERMVDINFIQQQLQVNYTLQMAKHIVHLLNHYQNTENLPVPADEMKIWQENLLKNDPFIERIDYMEKHYLVFILKSTSPVIENLQGKEIRYEYYENQWSPSWSLSELLDLEASDQKAGISEPPEISPPASPSDSPSFSISLFPAPIDFFYSMGIITDYCRNPMGYIYPKEGMVSDQAWCPIWHSAVMPLQD